MTIWKFPLCIQDYALIRAPPGAKLIHVGLDPSGLPCVWAEVEPENPEREIKLCVVGTGHTKPGEATTHLGSFVHGPFVWHVYYR